MIQRIETLAHVTKAGIINLLLWSGLFAFILFTTSTPEA